MISILVTNPKGGCGKTTVATNLAAAYAREGRRCVLADLDRQASSLKWLGRRPGWAPAIGGLDWSEDAGKAPKKTDVLVLDSPAGIKIRQVRQCLDLADVIVVPVLPSQFDQDTTSRFLDELEALKPVRKSKKAVAVVRNRVRKRSRAAVRLDIFMLGVDHKDLGWIPDRAVYNEAAAQGLALFDMNGNAAEELRADWLPLLRYIEGSA